MADLSAALDRAVSRLEGAKRDDDLAAELDAMAATLEHDDGDAITKKRRAALAETLSGITARLR